MSYSICRILKIKSSGVTGIQIHDRREKQFSHTNKDIDFSKSDANIDLLNQNQKFKSVIQDRIGTLNLKRKTRKDATVMVQTMLTSDEKFFKDMPRSEQIKFFEKSFEFIQDKYGKENMISATIHFDEKTPHLHINFVPITKDNRLSARDLFSPKLLRELQTDYNNYVNQQGYELERGKMDSKKKGLSVKAFKLETKEKELQRQVQVVNEKKQALENDLNHLSKLQKSLDNVLVDFKTLKPLEGKCGLLNKKKVTIDLDEFEEFKQAAQKCILNAQSFKKQLAIAKNQIVALEEKNEILAKYKSNYLDSYDNEMTLRRENQFLKSDKDQLNENIDVLTSFLKSKDMIQEFNDFIKEINSRNEYEYEYER